MTFVRDMLPNPLDYFEQQGIRLRGHGKQRQGPCLIHGGSDSLGVNIETHLWLCRNCGAKGGNMLDLHRQVHGLTFIETARQLGAWVESGAKAPAAATPAKPVALPVESDSTPRRLSDYGRDLWSACTGLRSTVAEAYLLARRCSLPPEDGDLRYHPALKHPSGYTGPALVALVTHAINRVPLTVHRAWIKPDGKKADVDPPRMLLGGHRKQGGVVRLWPDECVTEGLAIAEGIETALSLAHAYKPVWSLIDAGNLAAFPVLAGIRTLVVGADHDPAGMRAATSCADRWAPAGVDVRVIAPDCERSDWNDAAAEVAA